MIPGEPDETVDLDTLRKQLEDVLDEIIACGSKVERTRIYAAKMEPLLAHPVLPEMEREAYLGRAHDECGFPVKMARAALEKARKDRLLDPCLATFRAWCDRTYLGGDPPDPVEVVTHVEEAARNLASLEVIVREAGIQSMLHGLVELKILPESEATRLVTAACEKAASTAGDGRPRVKVPPNQFYDASAFAATLWDAIQEANDPATLFRFGDGLAWIERDPEGRALAQRLRVEHFRHWLRRRLYFYTITSTGESPIDGPPIVDDVLVTPSPPLPVLHRVVTMPVLATDGTVHDAPGYNARSGCYYAPPPSFTMPPVSLAPTPTERDAALALVLEMIQDFPFVDEADRTNALSALLTLFLRSMIAGPTPLFLLTKPSPGTGATLCTEAMVSLATGANPAVNGGPEEEAEWEKRLTSILLTAPAVVVFDNVGGLLDSDALSRALTAIVWEGRLLGASRNVHAPVGCVWLATANNLTLGAQMVRRVVPIRMDAQVERPWLRARDGQVNYTHPDLLAWVQAERPRLAHACLTLCRAWVAAGCPLGTVLHDSYPTWAATVGGVLTVAGRTDFLANLDTFAEIADVTADDRRAFLGTWWALHEDKAIVARDLYNRLLRWAPDREAPCALSLRGRSVASTSDLGLWLHQHHHQVVDLEKQGETPETTITFSVRIESTGSKHRRAWRLARKTDKGWQ